MLRKYAIVNLTTGTFKPFLWCADRIPLFTSRIEDQKLFDSRFEAAEAIAKCVQYGHMNCMVVTRYTND